MNTVHTPFRRARPSRALPIALFALLSSACSTPVLSPPRPVVMVSGDRLAADPARMLEIHDWVLAQLETISCRTIARRDPGDVAGLDNRSGVRRSPFRPRVSTCLFTGSVNAAASTATSRDQDPLIHISVVPGPDDVYPWETLVIQGDTARVQVPRAYPDIRTSYTVYAYLHLMDRQRRIEQWLPDAAGATGFELERAIMKRVADVWLMGRASFYLDPHRPMDELLHASEAGYLDAFLFTARPGEFRDDRRLWERDDPGGLEAYRSWFNSMFGREPPGLRAEPRERE